MRLSALFQHIALKESRISADKPDKGKCLAHQPVEWVGRDGKEDVMSEIYSAGNADRAQRIERVRGSKRVQRAQTQSLPRESDRVELSQEARALGTLKGMPAVREERVAAVKAKINDVNYDVDSNFRNAMQKLLEDFGA